MNSFSACLSGLFGGASVSQSHPILIAAALSSHSLHPRVSPVPDEDDEWEGNARLRMSHKRPGSEGAQWGAEPRQPPAASRFAKVKLSVSLQSKLRQLNRGCVIVY